MAKICFWFRDGLFLLQHQWGSLLITRDVMRRWKRLGIFYCLGIGWNKAYQNPNLSFLNSSAFCHLSLLSLVTAGLDTANILLHMWAKNYAWMWKIIRLRWWLTLLLDSLSSDGNKSVIFPPLNISRGQWRKHPASCSSSLAVADFLLLCKKKKKGIGRI